MYEIVVTDFENIETARIQTVSKDSAKEIYMQYIKRCIYGFPNIWEVMIFNGTDLMTSFKNWKR